MLTFPRLLKRRRQDQHKAPEDTASPGHFFREISLEFLLHELKDPVSIIETGVRSLLEKSDKYGQLTERQEKTLRRILRNSQKARSMLYDMLEIGRSEAGLCNCCRFNPVESSVEVLVEVLESAANRSVAEEFDGESNPAAVTRFLTACNVFLDISENVRGLELYQDPIKYRQIFGNLVKNAIHHRTERLEIRMRRERHLLSVEVSDDGPGVDPENHQKIFRRYAQVTACTEVARKGHGLGLAGALILSRCLGGNIDIQSAAGQGATFRLTLPLRYDPEGVRE